MSLRLMVYDRTCHGKLGLPGLTTSWIVGARLYAALGRLDAWYGAETWTEALDWLASVQPDRSIQEIQYWGHGHWGTLRLDGVSIDRHVLAPAHALHGRLAAIRDRMSPESTWWFRTCQTFGTEEGHAFARAWSDFFRCRVAGHTYIIGPTQSGLHTLRPGETPTWSVTEGLPADWAQTRPTKAKWSRWSAPNTISCLHGSIPEGY